MAIDVLIGTSAEEDLAALTDSRWELSLITPELETIGERQPIAPPTSQNTLSWKINKFCLAGGAILWRDGRWFKTTLGVPVRLQCGDTLKVHYNLMIG
jgi:hypothetical protein